MLRYVRYDQPATSLFKQQYNDEKEDISNPVEVTEKKTLAVQSIVDKNNIYDFIFQSVLHPFGHLSKMSPSYI